MKVFKCMTCGNVIIKDKDDGSVPICCGAPMKELKANTEDAAVEKHVPVLKFAANMVMVTCGEVLHPMEEKHYIEFIAIETDKGVKTEYLKPGDDPICSFTLDEGELFLGAYAYCNLHGLWKNK